MALQNLDMADIFITLGDYLQNNENIKEFCADHFGKELTVKLGAVLENEELDVTDCPYILILDGGKTEGLAVNPCTYNMLVDAGIATAEFATFITDSGSIMHEGYDLINKFLTLLQTEINKLRIINEITVTVSGAMNTNGSHWAGVMELSFEVEQIQGTKIQQIF